MPRYFDNRVIDQSWFEELCLVELIVSFVGSIFVCLSLAAFRRLRGDCMGRALFCLTFCDLAWALTCMLPQPLDDAPYSCDLQLIQNYFQMASALFSGVIAYLLLLCAKNPGSHTVPISGYRELTLYAATLILSLLSVIVPVAADHGNTRLAGCSPLLNNATSASKVEKGVGEPGVVGSDWLYVAFVLCMVTFMVYCYIKLFRSTVGMRLSRGSVQGDDVVDSSGLMGVSSSVTTGASTALILVLSRYLVIFFITWGPAALHNALTIHFVGTEHEQPLWWTRLVTVLFYAQGIMNTVVYGFNKRIWFEVVRAMWSFGSGLSDGVLGRSFLRSDRNGQRRNTSSFVQMRDSRIDDPLLQAFFERSSHTWALDPGTLDYGEKIGCGHSSEVYRGRLDGHRVAIKVLSLPMMDDVEQVSVMLEEFERECRALSTLGAHPNVVRFYGCALHHAGIGRSRQTSLAHIPRGALGTLSIVTELCALGDLFSWLRTYKRKKRGSGPPNLELLNCALQIARGMKFLHASGVIHRDLKPSNVMVDQSLTCKIADFGLSRQDEGTAQTAVRTGGIGTLPYMAPELLTEIDCPGFVQQNRHNDVAWHSRYGFGVDVYAFGVSLWVLWAQREPFTKFKGSPFDLTLAVLRENLRPEPLQDWPAPVVALMVRCWAADSRERPDFPTIERELEAIEPILEAALEADAAPQLMQPRPLPASDPANLIGSRRSAGSDPTNMHA